MLRISIVAALVLGCGGPSRIDDAGPGADGSSGADGGAGVDSGTTDAGMMSTDPCATAEATAISTVGCNGYATGDFVPNGDFGPCELPDPDGMPEGTCTEPGRVCAPELGYHCAPTCPIAASYVSTGGCPMGFRCFQLRGIAYCYRDCDAAHACPTSYECDGEGSCVLM